jgi:hypothetical protein
MPSNYEEVWYRDFSFSTRVICQILHPRDSVFRLKLFRLVLIMFSVHIYSSAYVGIDLGSAKRFIRTLCRSFDDLRVNDIFDEERLKSALHEVEVKLGAPISDGGKSMIEKTITSPLEALLSCERIAFDLLPDRARDNYHLQKGETLLQDGTFQKIELVCSLEDLQKTVESRMLTRESFSAPKVKNVLEQSLRIVNFFLCDAALTFDPFTQLITTMAGGSIETSPCRAWPVFVDLHPEESDCATLLSRSFDYNLPLEILEKPLVAKIHLAISKGNRSVFHRIEKRECREALMLYSLSELFSNVHCMQDQCMIIFFYDECFSFNEEDRARYNKYILQQQSMRSALSEEIVDGYPDDETSACKMMYTDGEMVNAVHGLLVITHPL